MRGDQYVTLVVQVPDSLSADAKEALRRYDELSGNSLKSQNGASSGGKKEGRAKKKGFKDVINDVKDAFNDI